jgi:hypothetical protein
MKRLTAALFVLALAPSAFAIDYFEGVDPQHCPGARSTGDKLYCRVAGGAIVHRGNFGPTYPSGKVPRVLSANALSAIDLGVLPDADTNTIFWYPKPVLDAEGDQVGFAIISGYENSEMGVRLKFLTKYNLKGKLVFAAVSDF